MHGHENTLIPFSSTVPILAGVLTSSAQVFNSSQNIYLPTEYSLVVIILQTTWEGSGVHLTSSPHFDLGSDGAKPAF